MARPVSASVALPLILSFCLACSPGTDAKSYELVGQIVAVDAAREELTIKHQDIKGFMPGMTMPFRVKDKGLMEGRKPGELIKARLVIEDSAGYITALEVTGTAPVTDPPPRPYLNLLAVGDEVPDAAFTDQNGHARNLSEWRGRAVAVTFVYTRCPLPDFCPLMDRQFAAVQKMAAGDSALKDRIHLVSVTLDPTFDTPPVLLDHAKRVGAATAVWSFVTGDQNALDAFASRFGLSVMRDDPGGIVHNLRTVVIDGKGRLTKIFTGNEWKADELAAELTRAAAAE